jgi:hypothetical protein
MGNTRHDFHAHNAEIEQLPLKQRLEASNYAAMHPNYFDVNRPEAHSAPTRSAAILNGQKA